MNEQSPSASTEPILEGPRPPRLEERDELIAMVNLIFRTSAGRPPTIGSDWEHVYAPENLANIAVISDAAQGMLVASTAVWVCDVEIGEAKLRIGGINCVGTLPDYRRHGLGSLVMSAAQQTMRDLGCHVGLLGTGIMNWYRRLGWEEAGMARRYRLNRGNIGLLPSLRPGLQLRIVEFGNGTDGEEAIDAALLALYHQQRMGAQRSVQSFRQRLAARNYDRLILAEETGRVVAYLLLHTHTVIEWAGAAEDVAALGRAAFAALDDAQASTTQRTMDPGPPILRTLVFETPGWQHPLTDLLDRLRIPFDSDYLGMLLLMDPQAVIAAYGVPGVKIEPLKRSEIGGSAIGDRENDAFILRAGQHQVTLDRRQLTKHFFGPERVSDVAAGLFPLPFWQWYLEKV